MKRTLAAVVTAAAMTGLTGAGLTGAGLPSPAAEAAGHRPAPAPHATLRVVPGWTYQGGKLAVVASCSQRGDQRVVSSKMLPRLVTLGQGPKLLIKVTGKTRPGQYTISLFCTGKHQVIDSVATGKVRILKVLGAFWQPDPPGLPKHFKPDVTVSSGPPAPAKKGHGKKSRRVTAARVA